MTSANDPASRPGDPPGEDDDYSATVLASHWIQRPGPETATRRERTDDQGPGRDGTTPDAATPRAADTRREDPPAGASPEPPPPVLPDRVEGTVLRFGPGVAGALAHRSYGASLVPAPPAPSAPPVRRGVRRHALPAVVLLCVLAFLAWQRLGPDLAVRDAAVTARPATVRCEGTADLVGTVTTNGRPGVLTYRWTRSDGTSSGVLREELPRGRTQARLHLLWSFEGRGRYEGHAELRLLTPAERTARVDVAYDCR
ncbi:hypothetical protein ABZ606_09405 [Streptomyces sp. NPDC012461]|jgi:hypothetical protein|uniref:hypothetical protein n=1 Tax=unclassified Streptomyces TaxID=2593676 RepID=UPI0033F81CDC